MYKFLLEKHRVFLYEGQFLERRCLCVMDHLAFSTFEDSSEFSSIPLSLRDRIKKKGNPLKFSETNTFCFPLPHFSRIKQVIQLAKYRTLCTKSVKPIDIKVTYDPAGWCYTVFNESISIIVPVMGGLKIKIVIRYSWPLIMHLFSC